MSEIVETQTDEAAALVTVARFMEPMEAQMARSALEASGIVVFLQGENASSLYPGTLSTRVLVSKEDEADAKEILSASVGDVNGPEGDDAL